MKIQRLPKNWFTWRDYLRLIIKQWEKYCDNKICIAISLFIDGVFCVINTTIRFILCTPILFIAIINVTRKVVVISAKKMLGLPLV